MPKRTKPAVKANRSRTATPGIVEIYPYKKGLRLRFIGANGKILNHEYDSLQSARRGAKAMEKLMRNYVVVRRK